MHVSADDLITALRGRGLRVTAPRRAVCRIVAGEHDRHLTAPGITAALAGEADQATVYRTLEALEEAGVLTHTHLGHGPSVYHLADTPPHHHLVCDECGTAIELEGSVLEEALAAIGRATGFVPDPGHVAISGRCARCASR